MHPRIKSITPFDSIGPKFDNFLTASLNEFFIRGGRPDSTKLSHDDMLSYGEVKLICHYFSAVLTVLGCPLLWIKSNINFLIDNDPLSHKILKIIYTVLESGFDIKPLRLGWKKAIQSKLQT